MKQEPIPTNADAPAETGRVKPRRRILRFPHSWKEVKALGWKMILGFVLFYLVRDSILYIILPYLAYKGFFD